MSGSALYEYDRAGFPMLWLEELGAFVHWLPVTKIQCEHFLCDVTDSSFDAPWYDQLLALNPRVSPKEIDERNYWRAIVTGVQPTEAERFARWCGEGYSLPTLRQWCDAYAACKEVPAQDIVWPDSLPARVRTLLARTDLAWRKAAARMGTPQTRADQMLMRLGAMEWVEDVADGYRWGGMGRLHPDFHGLLFTPDHGRSARPTRPEIDRLSYYGFRLLRRPQ
ncbi:MAG TPA: hypothetical protein VN970_05820 [Thermoanaerobaculia bacterium]|nr:hypothetical protein [Thermoanaerobaculia bacterium]